MNSNPTKEAIVVVVVCVLMTIIITMFNLWDRLDEQTVKIHILDEIELLPKYPPNYFPHLIK